MTSVFTETRRLAAPGSLRISPVACGDETPCEARSRARRAGTPASREAEQADLQVAIVGLGGECRVLRRQAGLLDDRGAALGRPQALVGEAGGGAELGGGGGGPQPA